MNLKSNSADTNGTATLAVNKPAWQWADPQAIHLSVKVRPVETWEVPLHRKGRGTYWRPTSQSPVPG